MGKVKQESLTKKLTNITRGAHWFGIIGRFSMLFGVLFFALQLFALLTGAEKLETHSGPLGVTPLTYVFYGWLFLLGRDAFSAIAGLIKEMEDVV